MPTRNEITRMDELLGRELGRNQFGESVYRWFYSENEMRRKVVTDHASQPVTRWVDRPVRDEEGNLTDKTILVQEAITFSGKAWPWLDHQWAVCMWDWKPQEEWERAFGKLLEWPPRGYYCPTNAVLDPGEIPTMGITEEFIGLCRAERSHSYADYIEQSEKAAERAEKRVDSHVDDVLADACNAFGHAKPGSRSGGISLPLPGSQDNYNLIQKGQ